MYFAISILVYFIYLYFLPDILKRIYQYKIRDIDIILNRYLIFAFLGYLLVLAPMFLLVQKGRLQKRSFIILLIALAAMIIPGYYYFIDTALNLVSWMKI